MQPGRIRTFVTGATRSPAEGKPEYAGYLSPAVMRQFGQYMLKHQTQSDGAQRDSRNWQKGIPLESYMQSMFRHFMDVWKCHEERATVVDEQAFLEALMALMFNVQGYCHEYLKGNTGGIDVAHRD